MPIENRDLEPGTVLTARYKKQDRTCEVVQANEGLRYKLDDGTEYKSPSSAGKAVTGGACNGWVFWHVEGTEQPRRAPKAKAETKPRAATKKAPAKKKGAKKGAAKKPKAARAASVASFGCGVCPDTFTTMRAATAHAMTHTS